jgi:hypothetical protein
MNSSSCYFVCCFLQVLEELGDIIDLPMRAAAVEELMNAGATSGDHALSVLN